MADFGQGVDGWFIGGIRTNANPYSKYLFFGHKTHFSFKDSRIEGYVINQEKYARVQ